MKKKVKWKEPLYPSVFSWDVSLFWLHRSTWTPALFGLWTCWLQVGARHWAAVSGLLQRLHSSATEVRLENPATHLQKTHKHTYYRTNTVHMNWKGRKLLKELKEILVIFIWRFPGVGVRPQWFQSVSHDPFGQTSSPTITIRNRGKFTVMK